MLKKYKNIIIFLSIFLIFILFLLGVIFLFYSSIRLKQKDIILNINSNYEEPGYQAKILFLDLTSKIKIKGTIDTSKPGTYTLFYELKILGIPISKNRKIIVRDLDKPIVTLKGETIKTICPNKEYEEEGYEAIDNLDGNITNKVEKEILSDKIIYTVSDSSGNQVEVERKIKKEDSIKPTINLKGNKNITIYQGETYQEPGYDATDNCDGNIKDKVKVSGYVNTKVISTYTLLYIVKDSNGNETTEKRTVTVKKKEKKEGIIYLTFDDGPSSTITPKILDILKKENVKATFFVINHDNSLNYLIKRAYDEGHTIALHSYTHNYTRIYASTDAYFEDLNKIREKVYKITGNYSNIIRFPGGSSNTVSKFNPKIMTTLAEQVEEKGFLYYDWNISSGDAGGAKTKDAVYKNVTQNLKNGTNMVLMHDKDGNYMTLNALEDIIHYAKENGYRFDKITSETPTIHHHINN